MPEYTGEVVFAGYGDSTHTPFLSPDVVAWSASASGREGSHGLNVDGLLAAWPQLTAAHRAPWFAIRCMSSQ